MIFCYRPTQAEETLFAFLLKHMAYSPNKKMRPQQQMPGRTETTELRS